MGSSKKHKKDRDVSSRRRSRSRSRSEEYREKKKSKKNRDREKERRHKRKSSERERSYHSDSSDVVEVPLDVPAPPVISESSKPSSRQQRKSRSMSPIPADGAGDCLSIEATNKLRAKLGLKPLEVGPSEVPQSTSSNKNDEKEERDESVADLKKLKDDWGEFYHKPAGQFNEKTEMELLREKIQSKRDKRKIEHKLARIKTLGESDSEDDITSWVDKSRKIEEEKKKAKNRAKQFEELDENMDQVTVVRKRPQKPKSSKYGEKDLAGLKVAHDIDTFREERQVILTLEDKDVLAEDEDVLMNVNMKDDERYKKNVDNRKLNPEHYGYDVYEDQYDEFGNFIDRGVLSKYDDDIDGSAKKSSFVIGESKELIREQQRKAMEVKAKLQGKTLESLNENPLRLASDHYTEEELTKFKKPKRKVKKLRQKLKADELLEITGDNTDQNKDLGSRKKREDKPKSVKLNAEMLPPQTTSEDLSELKIEPDDEDLEHILSKARRIKQKEIIKKELPIEMIKTEIKMETEDSDDDGPLTNIILDQTAEFCRTLGDIPTYGMAGNRDEATDMMDLEDHSGDEELPEKRGKWNQVDPNEEPKLVEGIPQAAEPDDVVVLDEEPDIAVGMANALKLAMSKGYLEKEESNRPSNTRFAHLQAKHYSIEDKAYGEDDKYSRRGHGGGGFQNGPLSEFREKSGYKPNVKLEYIDDNNLKLTPKEAFRYLSHKFHGKGPGKNKIEKRLKKQEQEGLMKKMSSSDTPLNTLLMLQQKQKETQSAFVVLSGNKSAQTTLGKNKR
ncbi:U4/U6.U5 tri-snRNP-associated protein 1 [Chironomus tepperi]|uniref:U4/U6.U5 tri-snRNP-associated protein 1 n=1 Tax=Chironomus tepperi TaxID=113505 RepID=UPI00391EE96C